MGLSSCGLWQCTEPSRQLLTLCGAKSSVAKKLTSDNYRRASYSCSAISENFHAGALIFVEPMFTIVAPMASGVDPRFSERGANGVAWRMAVAAGRVPLKLLPCVRNVCS